MKLTGPDASRMLVGDVKDEKTIGSWWPVATGSGLNAVLGKTTRLVLKPNVRWVFGAIVREL